MTAREPDNTQLINADMTILDVVSRYRETEAVFKQYDQKAGACLCCQATFSTNHFTYQRSSGDTSSMIEDPSRSCADVHGSL
jgi:hypothetical protein